MSKSNELLECDDFQPSLHNIWKSRKMSHLFCKGRLFEWFSSFSSWKETLFIHDGMILTTTKKRFLPLHASVGSSLTGEIARIIFLSLKKKMKMQRWWLEFLWKICKHYDACIFEKGRNTKHLQFFCTLLEIFLRKKWLLESICRFWRKKSKLFYKTKSELASLETFRANFKHCENNFGKMHMKRHAILSFHFAFKWSDFMWTMQFLARRQLP